MVCFPFLGVFVVTPAVGVGLGEGSSWKRQQNNFWMCTGVHLYIGMRGISVIVWSYKVPDI